MVGRPTPDSSARRPVVLSGVAARVRGWARLTERTPGVRTRGRRQRPGRRSPPARPRARGGTAVEGRKRSKPLDVDGVARDQPLVRVLEHLDEPLAQRARKVQQRPRRVESGLVLVSRHDVACGRPQRVGEGRRSLEPPIADDADDGADVGRAGPGHGGHQPAARLIGPNVVAGVEHRRVAPAVDQGVETVRGGPQGDELVLVAGHAPGLDQGVHGQCEPGGGHVHRDGRTPQESGTGWRAGAGPGRSHSDSPSPRSTVLTIRASASRARGLVGLKR